MGPGLGGCPSMSVPPSDGRVASDEAAGWRRDTGDEPTSCPSSLHSIYSKVPCVKSQKSKRGGRRKEKQRD